MFLLNAQDVGEVDIEHVKSKENTISLFLNTHGGGAGFCLGKYTDYYSKHYWETDFLYNAHYKAVRAKNVYWTGARSYCYGKKYDLFFLRTGYGYQRTLSHKPYWGGVETHFFFSGGFALGIGFPVYLDVLYYTDPNYSYTIVSELYDPEKHNLNNIIGSSEWYKRFKKIAFRPGFYVKTGVSFDFSQNEYKSHVLEIGVSADMVFPFIQQMAYNKAKPIYFCMYIAYNFGKKKGLYE